MIRWLRILLGTLRSCLHTHRELALENLALRQGTRRMEGTRAAAAARASEAARLAARNRFATRASCLPLRGGPGLRLEAQTPVVPERGLSLLRSFFPCQLLLEDFARLLHCSIRL